jgi:hypothetical protein
MDDALNRMQEIMKQANEQMMTIYTQARELMTKEQRAVKANQLELKSQLQDLVDTEKYLKLIEERNREIEKQKAEGLPEEEQERSPYADRQTKIRVNQEYLEKLGLTEVEETQVGESADKEDHSEDATEEKSAVEAEIRVNLDADYFRWKEEQGKEKSQPKSKTRARAQAKVHSKRAKK